MNSDSTFTLDNELKGLETAARLVNGRLGDGIRWCCQRETERYTSQASVVALATHLIELLDTAGMNDLQVTIEQGYVSLELPYNPAVLRRVRRLMKGAKFDYQHINADGNAQRNYNYRLPDGRTARLLVWMFTSVKGATCKRVKTGEQVTPVYTIVCE